VGTIWSILMSLGKSQRRKPPLQEYRAELGRNGRDGKKRGGGED